MYKTLNIKESKESTINGIYCARVQRFTNRIEMKDTNEIKKLNFISVTSFKGMNSYKKRDCNTSKFHENLKLFLQQIMFKNINDVGNLITNIYHFKESNIETKTNAFINFYNCILHNLLS